MKRTNNDTVAKLWAANEPSTSHNGNFSTDGRHLFSYNLLIGYTSASGKKVALLYNAGSDNYVSQTTSQHVGKARRVAQEEYAPHGADIKKPECWSAL